MRDKQIYSLFLILTLALAALAFVDAPPSKPHALVLVVDTTVDDITLMKCQDGGPPDCSLRGAITKANGMAGPDTITFDATTNGHPIVLTGTAGEDGNQRGDLDILGGGLTIQGNGPTNTIIDGGNVDRVFDVCPAGCANTSTFTFSGVTIQNGKVISGDGGGILNNSATLNIQNSTISGNQAESGGGIYNQTGTTTIDGSAVRANKASEDGGGIYNLGTLNVQNGSTIGGVGAGNEANDEGGGICNRDGTTTLDGSAINGNMTDKIGGGIYNQGTLSIQNSSTIGRIGSANTAGDNGGGIFNRIGGTVTVDASTIRSNTTNANGGGIYNQGTLIIKNGSNIGETGAGNTATGSGGGIYNFYGSTTVTGSRIQYNSATDNGGAVYNDVDVAGATSVIGSCIVSNSAKSFYNNQDAEQIATGNWWGVVTGPNTAGADTTFGDIDTSNFLTAPILGCAGEQYLYLPLVLR